MAGMTYTVGTTVAFRGLLIALVAGCTASTAPTASLDLRPLQASVTLAEVQATGMSARLINHLTDSVIVIGGGCFANSATLDEWVGGAWLERPPMTLAPCPFALVAPLIVASGDSVTVIAAVRPSRTGTFRMRIGTTGGEATSTAVDVH